MTSPHSDNLKDFGYAILPAVFDESFLHNLCDEYEREVQNLVASGSDVTKFTSPFHGNYRLGLFPPLTGRFGDERLFTNPDVLNTITDILGEDVVISYYNSNVSFPGAGFQIIHRDVDHSFSTHEMNVSGPPMHLAVSIPLRDFTMSNGGTEVWPATHNSLGDLSKVSEREGSFPPGYRLHAKRGDAVIRDSRLWHRGVPNNSEDIRPMLSIVYSRRWYNNSRIAVPPATASGWGERTLKLFSNSAEIESMAREVPSDFWQREPE